MALRRRPTAAEVRVSAARPFGAALAWQGIGPQGARAAPAGEAGLGLDGGRPHLRADPIAATVESGAGIPISNGGSGVVRGATMENLGLVGQRASRSRDPGPDP